VKQKRAFIAVNLSGKIKEEIASELLSEIPQKGMKKVAKENLHITVKFLGYVPEGAIKELWGKMDFLSALSPFSIGLGGIGDFKKRVLWLGAEKGSTELAEISEKIGMVLGATGEKFHAHVTIARNRSLEKGEFNSIEERLRGKGFSREITAESVDLMESVLGEKGPKYSVLERAFLKN